MNRATVSQNVAVSPPPHNYQSKNLKSTVDQLAALGGDPLYEQPLHVGSPNLPPRDSLYAAIDRILDNRWLTNNGEMVQAFEQRICDMLGVRNCVATVNGTAGIEIAIRAAELTGEIILPSFTFIATAHAAAWLGLNPIFCDVDPATHNIDPALIESLITERTSAIMAVHVWGRPCALDQLAEVSARHGLHLLYDAAHAFGCSVGTRPIGNFGNAEIFSFHATKFVSCFEGGAVVTNDDAYADRMRLMRNFGFSGKDNIVELGINAKLSEVCAAMGLCSLDIMPDIVAQNRQNYEDYKAQLSTVPGITPIDYAAGSENNYQYVVAEVDPERYGMDRDTLVALLDAERIFARRYFYPGCHQAEPYIGSQVWELPHTEALASRVISLPSGLNTKRQDITRVSQLIRFLQQNAAEINQALEEGGG